MLHHDGGRTTTDPIIHGLVGLGAVVVLAQFLLMLGVVVLVLLGLT